MFAWAAARAGVALVSMMAAPASPLPRRHDAAPLPTADDPGGLTTLHLGAADAPLRLLVFLDPVRAGTRATWNDLLLLVADTADRLRAEVVLVEEQPRATEPQIGPLRLWIVAMARDGRFDVALAEVEREGAARLASSLASDEGRAALSRRIGPLPGAHALEQAQRALDAARAQRAHLLLPDHHAAFVLDGTVVSMASQMETVRAAVARWRPRSGGAPDPRGPAPVTGRSTTLQRPILGAGLLLGGAGLAHHAVLFASDERDPALAVMLPPLLAARARHPGRLSLQILARGGGSGSETLERRLCHAQRLGLGSAFAGALVRGAAGQPAPDDGALREHLDAAGDCPTREPAGLPPLGPGGAWFDGRPVGRGELDLDRALPASAGEGGLLRHLVRPAPRSLP